MVSRVAKERSAFGAHLDARAHAVIRKQKIYPSPQVLANPLTRGLARAFIADQWRSRLDEIDFPYEMADLRIAGVPCVKYRTPKSRSDAPLLLYAHAGAFVAGSPRANAAAIIPACEIAGVEALGIGYGLAPESAFPRQIEQIVRVYRAMLEGGRSAKSIVLVGDSAGGGLVLSTLGMLARDGLPAPAGVIALSALTDCSGSSDSHFLAEHADPVFGDTALAGLSIIMDLYAPGRDPRDPLVSPIYASYKAAPPILIHAGSREVFLGDSTRLAEHARADGCDVHLRVHDGMFHLFHTHWRLDAARRLYADVARFIERVTG